MVGQDQVERARHIGGAERIEAQATAAAADRRQQAARCGAGQQQDGSRRRLFQHFQDRIGGVAVEVLGTVHDHHPPAALRRCEAQEIGDVASALDDDLRPLTLALVVPLARDGEQIGMGRLGDAAEAGVGRVLGVARVGQERPGEPIAEGGLADALGTGDQPGVVQPASAMGGGERGLGGGVAEQRRIVARRDHGRRADTTDQMRSAMSATSPSPSMRSKRLGSAAASAA